MRRSNPFIRLCHKKLISTQMKENRGTQAAEGTLSWPFPAMSQEVANTTTRETPFTIRPGKGSWTPLEPRAVWGGTSAEKVSRARSPHLPGRALHLISSLSFLFVRLLSNHFSGWWTHHLCTCECGCIAAGVGPRWPCAWGQLCSSWECMCQCMSTVSIRLDSLVSWVNYLGARNERGSSARETRDLRGGYWRFQGLYVDRDTERRICVHAHEAIEVKKNQGLLQNRQSLRLGICIFFIYVYLSSLGTEPQGMLSYGKLHLYCAATFKFHKIYAHFLCI